MKIAKETMRTYLFENDYNSHYKGYIIKKDTNTNNVFVFVDMTTFSLSPSHIEGEEEEEEEEQGKWTILDELLNPDKSSPDIITLFRENPELITIKRRDTNEPYYRPLLLYLCKWNETTQSYENIPLPESGVLHPLYLPPRRIHPIFGSCYIFSRSPISISNNKENIEYITAYYIEEKTVHLIGMEDEKDTVFPPEILKFTERKNIRSICYTEPTHHIDIWICKNRDAFQLCR